MAKAALNSPQGNKNRFPFFDKETCPIVYGFEEDHG